jgi:hypothetical protein
VDIASHVGVIPFAVNGEGLGDSTAAYRGFQV